MIANEMIKLQQLETLNLEVSGKTPKKMNSKKFLQLKTNRRVYMSSSCLLEQNASRIGFSAVTALLNYFKFLLFPYLLNVLESFYTAKNNIFLYYVQIFMKRKQRRLFSCNFHNSHYAPFLVMEGVKQVGNIFKRKI